MKRLAQFLSLALIAWAATVYQPANVGSQPPTPAPPVVVPTPTPTVDPISVPLAAIEGPRRVTGSFMVVVRLQPGAKATWTNVFPRDASPPIELELKDGRVAQWFQEPKGGAYLFRLRAQLPTDGLDPVEDVEHLVQVGPIVPDDPPPVVVDPNKPPVVPATPGTAATYVYEKDQHIVPAAVMSGLNKLNREKKVRATLFEQDTLDGTDQVPDQYKVPLAAAKEAGLPALVVTNGANVVRVVKSPTTEEQVVGAVQ